MSEDFERMAIGTMDEIIAIRKFCNDLIVLKNAKDSDVINNPAIRQKIDEIEQFYAWHVNTYPVIV